MPMDPQKFQVLHSALEDCRKLIAAIKIQRWEVLKWAIALNAGLVAAHVTAGKSSPNTIRMTALGVAVAAFVLILFYNERARSSRADAIRLQKQFGEGIIPLPQLIDPVVVMDHPAKTEPGF